MIDDLDPISADDTIADDVDDVSTDDVSTDDTVTDDMSGLAYEYLQRVSRRLPPNADSGDHGMWVDPVVYRGETVDGSNVVAGLIDAERYPGEAFTSTVTPEPEAIVPAFVADVGIGPTDIVGLAAPSTQLCDGLFFSLYRTLADTGAVLTTKYPSRDVRGRLEGVDPIVLDCTPGADADDGVDTATEQGRSLRCGDLTSMGVIAQATTTRIADRDATGRFGINTVTQLLSHHGADSLDRFLHELVGEWRNHGVGGLVHVPPAEVTGGDRCFGSAHFDYVVEIRNESGTVEARVRGKRDVEPVWRSIGVSQSGEANPFNSRATATTETRSISQD